MKSVKRLYEFFIPEHYDLCLDIKRPERKFSGVVTIDGKKTSEHPIVLHSKHLTISSVSVNGIDALFTQSSDEITILDNTPNGKCIVNVVFNGLITDGMHGIYPSYFKISGKKYELISTQLESHHAREVFPCIDEPEAKATFTLTLTTERGVEALSNMPALKPNAQNPKSTTHFFQTTPRMSTYLLAFVIGDLQKKTTYSQHGVEVNVWATKTHPTSSLDYALDIATRAVDFYDDYFDTPYPLPKIDHVAIPDFSAGAMENWGLITYRESALLANSTASQDTKKYVANVIAHELSHQWFGNLVTMRWWNDLWLNESFATFMQYVCLDSLEPSWEVWSDMTFRESVPAFNRDAIDGVQAIQVHINHPDEVNSLFDGAIVYAKGACLLKMLTEYIGSDSFQAGLTMYFKKYAYGNTEASDLWTTMSDVSGKDIKGFMGTWISQPGYPLVTVNPSGLNQERFFIGKHEKSDTLWNIPLFSSDPSMPELFIAKRLDRKTKKSTLLSVTGYGHYLTRYTKDQLHAVHQRIAHGDLSATDKSRLLHELYLLVKAGHLSASELVPFLLTLSRLNEEPVWKMIALVARNLSLFTESNKNASRSLGIFYKKLIDRPYKQLGWIPDSNDSTSDTQLRSYVLNLAYLSHDKKISNKALSIYGSVSIDEIDANIRVPVLKTILSRQKDSALFDKLFTHYTNCSSPEIKTDLMHALTSVGADYAQNAILGKLTDRTAIRPQDTKLWLMLMLHTPENRYISWRWLVDNWSWIDKIYGSDKSYDRFLQYAGDCLATQVELDEFTEFVADKRDASALSRTILIAENQIEARVLLIKNQSQDFIATLKKDFTDEK